MTAIHATARYGALGHAFRVTTDRQALATWLGDIWQPLVIGEGPARRYDVITQPGPRERGLWLDGDLVCATEDPRHAVAMLLWHVNRQAVASTDGLLLHAGGVSRHGTAVALIGPSGSGKSTLTATLVEHGLDYLSDEVVAIDCRTWAVRPYHKPLTLKSGSHAVLEHLAPGVDEALSDVLPGTWELPATSIRSGSLATSATPRLLIFPTYRSGAETELRPLSRADAALLLAESSFNPPEHLASTLPRVAELVRRCDTMRLVFGHLGEAAAVVTDRLLRSGREDGAVSGRQPPASVERRVMTLSCRPESGYVGHP